MKKLTILLSAFVFTLIFAGSIYAQTTINASAEVRQDLTVAEAQATNFGLVGQNFAGATNPEINPSDGTTANIQDATSVTVGFVSVDGAPNQTVDVAVATSITLTETGSTDVITLTPSYNYTYANLIAGDSPTGAVLGANTGAAFTMTLDGSTGADGQNTILIGGALTETKTTDLTAGSYTGTGSITVSYQ